MQCVCGVVVVVVCGLEVGVGKRRPFLFEILTIQSDQEGTFCFYISAF